MTPNVAPPTSREDCLALVRAFIAREGRTPTAREFGLKGSPRHPDLPHGTTVWKLFQGYANFWGALGVKTRPQGRRLCDAA